MKPAQQPPKKYIQIVSVPDKEDVWEVWIMVPQLMGSCWRTAPKAVTDDHGRTVGNLNHVVQNYLNDYGEFEMANGVKPYMKRPKPVEPVKVMFTAKELVSIGKLFDLYGVRGQTVPNTLDMTATFFLDQHELVALGIKAASGTAAAPRRRMKSDEELRVQIVMKLAEGTPAKGHKFSDIEWLLRRGIIEADPKSSVEYSVTPAGQKWLAMNKEEYGL